METFFTRSMPLVRLSLVVIAALVGTRSAFGHEGPPFPILMEKPLAGYLVSVYADPDIGEARFFIIIDSPAGGLPKDIPQVSMWTEPNSGRLERATYEAKRQDLKNRVEFKAEPYFDQRDFWTIGFQVTPPGGKTGELTTEVESTPPGYGAWDFAIYLFPFFFLGGFWVFAMVRRRRLLAADAGHHSADSEQMESRKTPQPADSRMDDAP